MLTQFALQTQAKIKVDYADSDDPYTNQYDECGKQGNYIHFTPNFLLSDTAVQTYGLRGEHLFSLNI